MTEVTEKIGVDNSGDVDLLTGWSARISSLEFKEDHKLMKAHYNDWTDSGSVLPKPEWERKKDNIFSHISITKEKLLKAEANFKISPSDAESKSCNTIGHSIESSLVIKSTSKNSFKAGSKNKVSLETDTKLPDSVQKIKSSILWSLDSGSDKYVAGSTGSHDIFVTYDEPREFSKPKFAVTYKRIDKSVEWVQEAYEKGFSDPVNIVNYLIHKCGHYLLDEAALPSYRQFELRRKPWIKKKLNRYDWPSYINHKYAAYTNNKGGAWPLAKYIEFQGECQAIVRLVRKIAYQVGLPGTFEAKYVTAKAPGLFSSKPKIVIKGEGERGIYPTGPGDKKTKYALAAGRVSVGQLMHEVTKKNPNCWNSFEAYLKYTYGGEYWFGGGIGLVNPGWRKYNLLRVFKALVRLDLKEFDTFRDYQVTKIWPLRKD
jgi:hypothetical protein